MNSIAEHFRGVKEIFSNRVGESAYVSKRHVICPSDILLTSLSYLDPLLKNLPNIILWQNRLYFLITINDVELISSALSSFC